MSSGAEDKTFLTPTEAAELLMVSPVTVRQWAQKGLLPANTTAGGHRRFDRQVIAGFARERGISVDFPDPRSSDQRLLIVDDNRSFNGYLVALFQTQVTNLEVHSAYDGFEAGRLIHRFRPGVVLLDIMMPGINGVEVCKSLKSDPETNSIRVVAMTGHHSEELERQILTAGAQVLLKKPFDAEVVVHECGFTKSAGEPVTS